MAMVQVNLRMPKVMLWRVDRARGDVSRNLWVRRAVERALATEPRGSEDARVSYAEPPAPAEQPDALERVDEILSEATVSGIGGRVSPPKPIPPRVPFRRDVKPFQRGEK